MATITKQTAAEHRQSAARKQAAQRARKRALGLKPMEVWAYPEHHQSIRNIADRLQFLGTAWLIDEKPAGNFVWTRIRPD